jgi:hypothetical protein
MMRPRRSAGRLRSCRSGDDHLFEMLVVEGHAPPEAAPEHLTVAEIARTATGPADPSELTDEPAVRAAFTAARTHELSRRRLSRLHLSGLHLVGRDASNGSLIARGMSMTAVALLAATGVAAAATGNLPADAQEPLSHSLAHIGISIPEPAPPSRTAQAADPPAPSGDAHTDKATTHTSPEPGSRPAADGSTAPLSAGLAGTTVTTAPTVPPDAASGALTNPQTAPTVTTEAPPTKATAPATAPPSHPATTAPAEPVTTTTDAPPTTTTDAPPTTTTAPDPTTTTEPALGLSTDPSTPDPSTGAATTVVTTPGTATGSTPAA